MFKSGKSLLSDNSIPLTTKLNDYFVAKVVDWTIKNHVDTGRPSEFKWDLEDKQLLTKIFEDPKSNGLNLPMKDAKFKRFVYSIIQNGLNTADVNMFVRYKDKLPLRSLGLAYDINDFVKTTSGLNSKLMLNAGFYMLEIIVEPNSYSSNIQVECIANYSNDNKLNKKKLDTFKLRAKSEAISKRLVWLENDANVSLDISSSKSIIDSKKDVTYLRFARLTKNFFLSRLFKKIGKEYDISKHSKLSVQSIRNLWDQYDLIFKPVVQGITPYSQFVFPNVNSSIPSPDEQMKRILKLIGSR